MEMALELAKAGSSVEVNLALSGIVAVIAGVLILVMPKLLNYIVAGYLIVVGLVDIFNIRL